MDSEITDEEMSSGSDSPTSSTSTSPRTAKSDASYQSEGPIQSGQGRIFASSTDEEEEEGLEQMSEVSPSFPGSQISIQIIQDEIRRKLENEEGSGDNVIYPSDMRSFLQIQQPNLLHRIKYIVMKDLRGWTYMSRSLFKDISHNTKQHFPETSFLDAICFTPSQPVKVVTFCDGRRGEDSARKYNSKMAGIVVDSIIRYCQGFKFGVVHGAVRNNLTEEEIKKSMEEIISSARGLAVPHALDMNLEKFKTVSKAFLTVLQNNEGTTESMDTMDTVEKKKYGDIHTGGMQNTSIHAECVSRNEHENLLLQLEKCKQDYLKLKGLFDQERGNALELASNSSHDSAYAESEFGSDIMTDISSISGDSGLQADLSQADDISHAGIKRNRPYPHFEGPPTKQPKGEVIDFVRPTARGTRRNKQRRQRHLPETYSATMNTSLHIACIEGLLGSVDNIISCGFIDINCRGDQGKTALMLAAEKGNVSIFDYIVSRDCDRNTSDDNGNTVLHAACFGGEIGIITRILQWGMVDRNRANNVGFTAMMVAEQNGRTDVCLLLKSSGCQ